MNRIITKLCSILLAAIAAVFSSSSYATPITSKSDAALTAATTIDFDSTPHSEFFSASGGYTEENVNFNSNGSFKINDFLTTGPYPIYGNQLHNEGQSFSAITFTFAESVSAFGMTLAAFDATHDLVAYDNLGNVLESIKVLRNDPSYAVQYAGIASDQIAYATLTFNDPTKSSTADWFGIDDFAYVLSPISAVSEPSALILLALGLASIRYSLQMKLNAHLLSHLRQS